MLSLNPQQDYQHQPRCLPFRPFTSGRPSSDLPLYTMAMGNSTASGLGASSSAKLSKTATTSSATVAQALEVARESPDGASDSTISGILEEALEQTWSKITAQPSSYIMSRDEFAVFNYFQHRFVDNRTATEARSRYWDNMTGPPAN
ncbi:hypothetical protein VD0002_g10021 [Verticillium dahliae]|nr:hypothetical protein VD0004_g9737 [Verticillium dahliae]PNH40490.1 hypothetical protein VD0003_g10087 [Verticillium dahliae]PNH54141.1 hypothetical protein VD0002_g10021 [Verticillium dahliae]PNH60884.1 hypothetical protein VD0001_g9797 [Verticillium dahliae]RXG48308.1 hypothetical protein VDGE_08619 [Verticillium dahliae]